MNEESNKKKMKSNNTTGKRNYSKSKKNNDIKKATLVENKKSKFKFSDILLTDDSKKVFRFIAIFVIVCCLIFATLFFIFSIVSTLAFITTEKSELLKNDFIVNFFSMFNNYSVSDIKNSMSVFSSNTLFIIFEILLPSFCIIGTLFLTIDFTRKLYFLVNSFKSESDIYNKDNIKVVNRLIEIVSTILFVTFILFNDPSIFIFIIIEILLYYNFYLYKKICYSK